MSPNREADDQVLAQLAEHGDVGAISRPVFIWIYGPEEDLRLVASRMAASGWLSIELEDQGDTWVLRADQNQPATPDAIYAMSDGLSAAIEGTGAEYDGWETSVERSN